MHKLSTWLDQISTGWLTVLMVVVFVLFMIFVLPDQAAKAEEFARGADSPDMSFFYLPEDLFQMAADYGETGRQAYIRARFTFDLVFPVVYGLFLLTSISWLGKGVFSQGSRWRMLNLVPVLGVLFDLLENGFTSIVMAAHPNRPMAAAVFASGSTLVKWVLVYTSFIVLFTFGVLWLYKQIKK